MVEVTSAGFGTELGATNTTFRPAEVANGMFNGEFCTTNSLGLVAVTVSDAGGVPGLAAFTKVSVCGGENVLTGFAPKSNGEFAGTKLRMSPSGVSESVTW